MGRKRTGASVAAPLAGRKRHRPEHATSSWTSLSTDMVGMVISRLLDSGDITDYVVFRAVCSGWRACTPTPLERDPGLCDPHLRPRGWVALCDGDAIRPEDTREIDMFHTRTARRFRVRVPDLRCRRIIGFSDGLLVLIHKTSAKIRVLNPFTCVAVDFQSLAPIYRETRTCRSSFLAMNAGVCTTSSSIAVVIWFPHTEAAVVSAKAGSEQWDILHPCLHVRSALVYQGRLYVTMARSSGTVHQYPSDIVQLYPPTPGRAAVAHIPNMTCHPGRYHMLLVESGGQMLLVVPPAAANSGATSWWKEQLRFMLYEVNLNNNDGGAKLTSVSCLHDRALFLSNYGCMSVSADDLPSLRGNSIYFSMSLHPVLMYSLATGLSQELEAECQIHDGNKRIRPSVRPFTIVDHLLTFCHPKEWTKGLMFHEYYFIPSSFKELWNKIKAKESEQLFPRK